MRFRTVRRIGIVAAMTCLAGGAAAIAASPALAASGSCAGIQVASSTMQLNGGGNYGTLYLYYDSSTGRNCAKATNGVGQTAGMDVSITRCAPGTGQSWTDCDASDPRIQGEDYDSGSYRYYAGPVTTLGSAQGVCIWAEGSIDIPSGGFAYANIGGHCG
jgi:hypothetical protein